MDNRSESFTSFVPLDRSLKKKFPFSLACPSFVYRAGYLENVRHLAPFVDEIQLLFFESRFPESLPTPGLVNELRLLADNHDLTYNIHLPTDLFPGHPDPGERRHAADTIEKLVRRCEPLDPTTFTLHLNQNPASCPRLPFSTWQGNVIGTMEKIMKAGLSGHSFSIENIDDQLEQVDEIIRTFDLSVCMDIGHLMAHGMDIFLFYRRWKEHISMLHLHGVESERDHLPLDRLSPQKMEQARDILFLFNGPVTVEVYSYDALNASFNHLRKWLDNTSTPIK